MKRRDLIAGLGGNLPTQQPALCRLVVNLRVGGALGVTVPQSILVHADEIIE
jgi:hypothetical protein